MTKKDSNKRYKEVTQFHLDDDINIIELIRKLSNTGFNAKRLAIACKIYEEMINNAECKKFFGLAGALVPAGFQGIVYDFIKEDFIDILVTTGANLTHDLAESLGFHHLQGELNVDKFDDQKYHNEEMNRIYDVFLPNEVYEGIEDFISALNIPESSMSVSDFLKYLGGQLPKGSKSILKICAKKNVPIFCPAFTDSGLALQLGFHHQNLNLNHFKDMRQMVDIAWDSKKAGVCIIGGGVPKNFIFQSLQFCPNSADYAIQITMDRPEPGGLSGATLQEAISWGKIGEKAQRSTVISDASIVLPILLWYLKKVKP
jgi:deoxyhypusine synthase